MSVRLWRTALRAVSWENPKAKRRATAERGDEEEQLKKRGGSDEAFVGSEAECGCEYLLGEGADIKKRDRGMGAGHGGFRCQVLGKTQLTDPHAPLPSLKLFRSYAVGWWCGVVDPRMEPNQRQGAGRRLIPGTMA